MIRRVNVGSPRAKRGGNTLETAGAKFNLSPAVFGLVKAKRSEHVRTFLVGLYPYICSG